MAKKSAEAVKTGSLRVWWIPQVPMKAFRVPVESPAEAAKLLYVLAMYDIFQFENRVKPDYSNMGGLEVFEGGEWCDWENEDGDGIDDAFDDDLAELSEAMQTVAA